MADEWHVSAELMERFLSEQATREETRTILAHLIHGCRECSGLAQRLLREGIGLWFPKSGEPATVEQLEELFDRAFEATALDLRRMADEKLQGWAQWSSLDRLLPEERKARVTADPSMHAWGFHQRLIEASRWYSRNDPLEGVDIVRLAIVVAERLDADTVGGQRARQDLLAETHALLGSALRLASNYEEARMEFNEAWRHADLGADNPLTKGYILRLEASWMVDMGEFETAEAALEEALIFYRELGDRSLEGRTLVKMGIAIGYADAARGVQHIRQALSLIDAKREPRVWLCAQHDLAWFLAEAGHAEESQKVLDEARSLYKQFPDDFAQLRLHWLEGKITRSKGQAQEAAHIFSHLLDEFYARDLRHEILFISIDLAEAYTAAGRFEEAAKLTRDVYPIMTTWKMHRHALAAWLIFQNALELRQVDGIFANLRIYYRRYWNKEVAFTAE
jgi:tetratricopeptide (TPR) repeat protein